MVPFTLGTGIDLVARQIAPALSVRLKRPVFIDNKPGASGNIGTLEVVRAVPDGTTLLVSVNTLVMNPALYPKAGFNPLTDLTPISITSRGQLLLVAGSATKIDSLQGLIARARAKPGALNYGSPGRWYAAPPGDGTAEEPRQSVVDPHRLPWHSARAD